LFQKCLRVLWQIYVNIAKRNQLRNVGYVFVLKCRVLGFHDRRGDIFLSVLLLFRISFLPNCQFAYIHSRQMMKMLWIKYRVRDLPTKRLRQDIKSLILRRISRLSLQDDRDNYINNILSVICNWKNFCLLLKRRT